MRLFDEAIAATVGMLQASSDILAEDGKAGHGTQSQSASATAPLASVDATSSGSERNNASAVLLRAAHTEEGSRALRSVSECTSIAASGEAIAAALPVYASLCEQALIGAVRTSTDALLSGTSEAASAAERAGAQPSLRAPSSAEFLRARAIGPALACIDAVLNGPHASPAAADADADRGSAHVAIEGDHRRSSRIP